MLVYINELSLQGQFAGPEAFLEELKQVYTARVTIPGLLENFFCSRSFGEVCVAPELTCRDAIMRAASREVKGLLLGWISKLGPFLDDNRLPEEEDYFEFEQHDVTEQGLGEAARRLKNKIDATVFSFIGGEINFERSPLRVDQGLQEARIASFDIRNIWRIADLRTIETDRPAESWEELIVRCQRLYELLEMQDQVLLRLRNFTFYPSVAERVISLLGLLNEVMLGRRADGSLNDEGLAVWSTMTRGERARFSDESDQNKAEFEHDMTFTDAETGEDIFCPWHAKIQTPQFRIHFEWPVPINQKKLRVFYIGPKITKR